VERWRRRLVDGGPRLHVRAARLRFLALLDGPDIAEAEARARAAFPDEDAWQALEVTERARAIDGGRFDEAVGGRAAHALDRRSPHERWLVERCQRYATIEARLPDEATASVLQAAEALLHALAVEGDLVLALDLSTAEWRDPDEVRARPAARPFVPDEHFVIVVEAVERGPGVGHLVRSRGLDKFARPDVGAHAPKAEAEPLAERLRAWARRLVEGEAPPHGGRPLGDDGIAPAAPDEAALWKLFC
jgi:hypothetical protein